MWTFLKSIILHFAHEDIFIPPKPLVVLGPVFNQLMSACNLFVRGHDARKLKSPLVSKSKINVGFLVLLKTNANFRAYFSLAV